MFLLGNLSVSLNVLVRESKAIKSMHENGNAIDIVINAQCFSKYQPEVSQAVQACSYSFWCQPQCGGLCTMCNNDPGSWSLAEQRLEKSQNQDRQETGHSVCIYFHQGHISVFDLV